MKTETDQAIVLSRVNYGERDRILTLLTYSHGKISVLAKGVRTQKSRLAGGIELLSISDISFIKGKSDLCTLTGARLVAHFANIAPDIDRTETAFRILKDIAKTTEDVTDKQYFDILRVALSCLDDQSYDPQLVYVWTVMQILQHEGLAPNIQSSEGERFAFDHDQQVFMSSARGEFSRNDLKLLHVCLRSTRPLKLKDSEIQTDAVVALCGRLQVAKA